VRYDLTLFIGSAPRPVRGFSGVLPCPPSRRLAGEPPGYHILVAAGIVGGRYLRRIPPLEVGIPLRPPHPDSPGKTGGHEKPDVVVEPPGKPLGFIRVDLHDGVRILHTPEAEDFLPDP
jgi:hypothetical protein